MIPPPRTRLEIRDLRLILALAKAGTTAKAAPVLHLTQPAISRALISAEERLGVRLFERTPRGLVPTDAGARVLAGATPLLMSLGELEASAREPAPAPQRIRLVCECYTAYHWLPSVLRDLRESLPYLELELALEHTSSPVAALERGEIDVALLTVGRLTRAELVEQPLFTDELVFLVSPSHPLASKRALEPNDLCAHPLLTTRAPVDETRWFMRRVFGRARPRLRVEQLPVTEAILEMARAELGVALLSEWIAGPHLFRSGLVAKRLSSGPLLRPWRIAHRPDESGALDRLREALVASVPRSRTA